MTVALKTKSYAVKDAKSPLAPLEIERREPGPNDVLIEIKYCGVCHSDIHQARDEWGGSIFPMVPGHEIVGHVSKVGAKVSRHKVGDAVGVGCLVDSCRSCDSCKDGLEQYCEKRPVYTYNGLEKDGKTPTYGGYSTHVVVDENYVVSVPKNLPLDAAAPLLCAGITTYSPLIHWKAAGKNVAVVGLGGLGHMGVKLAKAMGSKVTVLSSGTKKKDDAIKLGADSFHATSQPETFKQLNSSFDFILDTVSAEHDLNALLSLLKRDGALCLVGAPPEGAKISAFNLLGRRRTLCGSGIGGIAETQEMLDFCGKHNVTSDVEVIAIDKVNEAYERMLKGDVRYRFVIDIASLK